MRVWPASVQLYCGYAYESGLISESYRSSFGSMALFLIGMALLSAFCREQNWGLLSLAVMVLCGMASVLIGASFFWTYLGTYFNTAASMMPMITSLSLMVFLTTKAGRHRTILWWVDLAVAISAVISVLGLAAFAKFDSFDHFLYFLLCRLPYWTAFCAILAALVLGALFWRKESRFYRLFIPVSLGFLAIAWIAEVLMKGPEAVLSLIGRALSSGQVDYLHSISFPGVAAAAVVAALSESVQNELNRRTEKRLIEQQHELTRKSYETLRRHTDEVSMMRHDLYRHFSVMQEMTDEAAIREYLKSLTGQYQQIRPVVQTGNEVIDIILNGTLSAAMDDGIHVEVVQTRLPEKLPLTDADLCSLIMNVVDNSIQAASTSGAQEPFIRIKIHIKDDFLGFMCENSADHSSIRAQQNDVIPRHGLGLKIVRSIAERCNGMADVEFQKDHCQVRIAIPMNQ